MATCSKCKSNVGCGCNLLDLNGKKLCSSCYSIEKNKTSANELSPNKPSQEQEENNNRVFVI